MTYLPKDFVFSHQKQQNHPNFDDERDREPVYGKGCCSLSPPGRLNEVKCIVGQGWGGNWVLKESKGNPFMLLSSVGGGFPSGWTLTPHQKHQNHHNFDGERDRESVYRRGIASRLHPFAGRSSEYATGGHQLRCMLRLKKKIFEKQTQKRHESHETHMVTLPIPLCCFNLRKRINNWRIFSKNTRKARNTRNATCQPQR